MTSEPFREIRSLCEIKLRAAAHSICRSYAAGKSTLKTLALIGYHQTKPDDSGNRDKHVHFFPDDDKFEAINYPDIVPDVKSAKGVDFMPQRIKGYYLTEQEFAESLGWNEHNVECAGKAYWITVAGDHGERLVYEVGNEASRRQFPSTTAAMDYLIGGVRLGGLTAELTFII